MGCPASLAIGLGSGQPREGRACQVALRTRPCSIFLPMVFWPLPCFLRALTGKPCRLQRTVASSNPHLQPQGEQGRGADGNGESWGGRRAHQGPWPCHPPHHLPPSKPSLTTTKAPTAQRQAARSSSHCPIAGRLGPGGLPPVLRAGLYLRHLGACPHPPNARWNPRSEYPVKARKPSPPSCSAGSAKVGGGRR